MTDAVAPGLSAGAIGRASIVVSDELCVSGWPVAMPPVYATKHMIGLMELAAAKAVQPALPDGWVTLGIEVRVRHLAPTPTGRMVTATATVTGVSGDRIEFDVEAHDGVRRIGSGTHLRAAIDRHRFEEKLLDDRSPGSHA